jgi:hypothetical protein
MYDLFMTEYLEYINSLLQQAEEDGFLLEQE